MLKSLFSFFECKPLINWYRSYIRRKELTFLFGCLMYKRSLYISEPVFECFILECPDIFGSLDVRGIKDLKIGLSEEDNTFSLVLYYKDFYNNPSKYFNNISEETIVYLLNKEVDYRILESDNLKVKKSLLRDSLNRIRKDLGI